MQSTILPSSAVNGMGCHLSEPDGPDTVAGLLGSAAVGQDRVQVGREAAQAVSLGRIPKGLLPGARRAPASSAVGPPADSSTITARAASRRR